MKLGTLVFMVRTLKERVSYWLAEKVLSLSGTLIEIGRSLYKSAGRDRSVLECELLVLTAIALGWNRTRKFTDPTSDDYTFLTELFTTVTLGEGSPLLVLGA